MHNPGEGFLKVILEIALIQLAQSSAKSKKRALHVVTIIPVQQGLAEAHIYTPESLKACGKDSNYIVSLS